RQVRLPRHRRGSLRDPGPPPRSRPGADRRPGGRAEGDPVISLLVPIAHGLLIGRQDLPIPAWLFAWGASVVLIVSFVALSVAWRESRFEDDSWRPAPGWLSALLVNRVTSVLAGALGAFLLGFVVWTGLHGASEAGLNFSV